MEINKKVEKFKNNFQSLNKDTLHLLDDMYEQQVVFQDPLHRIQGLGNLKTYFENMYSNVASIRFSFKEEFVSKESAVLLWQMKFRHNKLRHGNEISVGGSSHIIFKERCSYHRDYFDAGEMLYENLPFLRGLIRVIKNRVN